MIRLLPLLLASTTLAETLVIKDPATLRATLEQTDRDRIAAITAMFARFGFPAEEAQVRAYTVYYTQIGYISMMVRETVDLRIRRMPIYVRTFAGVEPKPAEIARFMSRHGFEAN
jgi:hypothetical protein